MKYIKTYENFTPITINNAKPFKVKKGLNKSMMVLRKSITSLRRRLGEEKSAKRRSELNRDINIKTQKLAELNFKNLKQIEYFANNPIVENLENSEDESLLSILKSSDFKPEDILSYMGLEKNDYEIDTEWHWETKSYVPNYSKNGITFYMKLDQLEDLMGIENGFISYLFNITSNYSSQDYYVDDEELNYLQGYLSESNIKNIKKLADLLNYDIDLEAERDSGEIRTFFEYIGLKSELEDFKREISYENERAIEKSAYSLLNSLPFSIEYKHSGKFTVEVDIEYERIIEYMETNKKDVKNIKEFFENINESSDFTYDFEQEGKYDFMGDFKDLQNDVYNVVDKYLSSPDDIFVKLIECNNLEMFKRKIDLANFTYTYDFRIDYDRKRGNLFNIALLYNNSILEWFKTYEFQENIIDSSDPEMYKLLDEAKILNPKIQDEYGYLVDSENYNL